MNRLMNWSAPALLAATLLVASCSKKSPPGEPSAASEGGEPAAEGLKLTDATHEKDGLSIRFKVPEGWKSQPFGDSAMYTSGKGLYPSQVIVGPTCEGSCSKLAENVAGMGKNQLEMHQKAKYEAKIVKEEHEGTRHWVEYEISKRDKTMKQLDVALLEPGWDKIAKCTVQANTPEDVARWSTLKEACTSLAATAK